VTFVTSKLVRDAQAVSAKWLEELDLSSLTEQRLEAAGLLDRGVGVDVVAIGKASREMSGAAKTILGARFRRELTICDEASASLSDSSTDVVVGEHPVPGEGSLHAGARLVDFLDESTHADCTLFLLSGGASSLCVLPEAPLTLEDLRGVWNAAMTSGVDITTLNKIRASSSAIAGGAVLRHVRTARSQSFILVDNVISGAEWVASALTYDYLPTEEDVTSLLALVGLNETSLGERLLQASLNRAPAEAVPTTTRHENAVLAEPKMMLDYAVQEARRRGYRVLDMGSHVQGDVERVSEQWADVLRRETSRGDSVAVLGVGEVTVRVRGTGRGGRCQEFAWLMARAMADLSRDAAFVARASDGRDFVEGVGGAWVERSTMQRARRSNIDWSEVARANDTYGALSALGQLLQGGHSGWNLCDLYVAVMDRDPSK
jgi:glycerate-2-kinase